MADVVLKGIHKSYGEVKTLHGIDLEIADGEFIVFVGPSGCGKSTLLRSIAGLEDISAGELYIGGRQVNDEPPARRGVSMVFQSYALYPHMNVAENMAFGLHLAGYTKAQQRAAVENAARILQIEHLLERKPKALSGGQRQRVAIGRAIVRKPDVFLFDEPLSNLDAALRVQMRIEIAKLHKQLAATMIYVTHDQVEAMTLADRIVVLNAGLVEQVGAPLELYHNPATLFVAGFIGSPKMNFLEATVVSGNAQSATVALPQGTQLQASVDASGVVVQSKVTVGFRAEHVELVGAGQAPSGNVLQGEVMAQERLGDLTYLYVQVPDSEHLMTVRAHPSVDAAAGSRVWLHIPEQWVYMFNAEGKAFARHAVSGEKGGSR
ncbi:ABC transporter ATP-binding protein [Uliginosibacterium gangwonense]|uniref:ABC transporter ATP-binding protein n=1 Tax=Uliginosibacterium gangwonense TaxID=392736 RepID=UPI000368E214|nr:sn-glycerol-3-phosphate ABC transporter ATP-binding protein UgpC [Uliginosibacterium gangwonense]